MKVALAGLLVCLAGRAAADPRPPISLRLEPSVETCVAGDTAAVRQAVAIELGTALVDDDENPAAQVSVTCAADEATIQIHSSLTDRTTVRRLVLAGEPVVSRPRLLGLAIAETVAASWAEPETPATGAATPATLPASPDAAIRETPETPPAPPGAAIPDTSKTPPASPAAAIPETPATLAAPTQPTGNAPPPIATETPVAPPIASSVTLGASAIGRVFSSGGLATLGARVVGDTMVSEHLALALDLAGERGTVSATLGDVDFTLFSLATRVELVWPGRIEARLGAGVRFGLADVNGVSHSSGIESHRFVAPWGGPIATAEARARIVGPIAVAVGVEAGYATLSVAAQLDGTDIAHLEGAWGSVWISIVYSP